jgi:hypothetical protein
VLSFLSPRLKGLEQVSKATMLGHLLPVLLTSLMHPNLQTLTLADALMYYGLHPLVVSVVFYTQVFPAGLAWPRPKGRSCLTRYLVRMFFRIKCLEKNNLCAKLIEMISTFLYRQFVSIYPRTQRSH